VCVCVCVCVRDVLDLGAQVSHACVRESKKGEGGECVCVSECERESVCVCV